MTTDKHHGLSRYRFRDNPEERRFADAWQAHNDTGRTLDYLLDPRKGEPFGYPLHAEDRERVVAATVMQWLGSPVGQGFLRDLGYVRADAGKADTAMLAKVREVVDGLLATREASDNPGDVDPWVERLLALFPERRTRKAKR